MFSFAEIRNALKEVDGDTFKATVLLKDIQASGREKKRQRTKERIPKSIRRIIDEEIEFGGVDYDEDDVPILLEIVQESLGPGETLTLTQLAGYMGLNSPERQTDLVDDDEQTESEGDEKKEELDDEGAAKEYLRMQKQREANKTAYEQFYAAVDAAVGQPVIDKEVFERNREMPDQVFAIETEKKRKRSSRKSSENPEQQGNPLNARVNALQRIRRAKKKEDIRTLERIIFSPNMPAREGHPGTPGVRIGKQSPVLFVTKKGGHAVMTSLNDRNKATYLLRRDKRPGNSQELKADLKELTLEFPEFSEKTVFEAASNQKGRTERQIQSITKWISEGKPALVSETDWPTNLDEILSYYQDVLELQNEPLTSQEGKSEIDDMPLTSLLNRSPIQIGGDDGSEPIVIDFGNLG